MKNRISLALRSILLVVLFVSSGNVPFARLIAADDGGEGVPTPEELATLAAKQVPAHFAVKSVEIVEVEEKGNALIKIFELSLKVSAALKENLYKSMGAEDGKIVLQVSANAGDAIELDGKAVATLPLSSIGNLERTVQVFVFPASPQSQGSPLSLFSDGTYRIAATESVGPETQTPSGRLLDAKTTATPNPSDDAIEALLRIFRENGEVWGADNSQNGFGTPIVLRELESAGPDQLSGKLDFLYQRTSHPFTIQKKGRTYSFQILKSLDPNAGTRTAIYGLSVDAEKLKGIRALEFPLSPAANMGLRESFARSLVPWEVDGDISDYIQVNGNLVNIETLELVSDDWISVAVRPVEDLPSRFYAATSWLLSAPPFGAFRANEIRTQEPRFRRAIAPLERETTPSWVSPDLQRFFQIKEGDVWKGELDWKTGESVGLENVTNLELLTNCEPITWYRDTLYLRNLSAYEKPILRIDLETGELEELPDSGPFNRAGFGSPDGRYLSTSDGRDGLLHVFDAESQSTFTIDATRVRRQYGGLRKERPMPFIVQPTNWINEHIFLTQEGWFDLEKRSRLLFNEIEGITDALPMIPRVQGVFTIPGHVYLDVTVNGYSEIENGQAVIDSRKTLRFRINRETKETVPLPIEFKSYGVGTEKVWVDENRYLFAKMEGGLSEIGTWLYDIRTGADKRLTPFFPNGSARAENVSFSPGQDIDFLTTWFTGSSILVVREKNKCVFRSQKGSKDELMIVDLSGGEIGRMPFPASTPRGSGLRQIVDRPLRLLKTNP